MTAQFHITFSEPAGASLRQALFQNKCDKILTLTEDFSVGPITALDTIQGPSMRVLMNWNMKNKW
jgi:hypothetical protein